MNLNFYVSPNDHRSIFRAIPICRLNEVKQILKEADIHYRVKYRGPRKHDGRFRDQQQAGCLRRNATHFAVYSTEKVPLTIQFIKDSAYSKLGLT